ncbi:MAG: anthranilate synthase component I family protein [Flavobacteriales bacterium]|nr:anthranilate synthase component I family protein [Flavobacteriales bacterium]
MEERIRISIPDATSVDWGFLRDEPYFLYRLISDQDRAVLGVGCIRQLDEPVFNDHGAVEDWCFGALRYEWKDALEPALGRSKEQVSEPHCRWFIPRFVVEWKGEEVSMHVLHEDSVVAREWASGFFRHGAKVPVGPEFEWVEQFDRGGYLGEVAVLMQHIRRGDIYEVNYCIPRRARSNTFDPFGAFARLLERSAAPYAGFFRWNDAFAVCASPERFMAFEKDRILGQPMKGTRPRSLDRQVDERLRRELAADEKERSENVMALDVMRHDFSKVAAPGSVLVRDLCAVVSLPKVHQMVSTVSASLRSGLTPYDALAAAFPMASMTGAPKVRAMQLIEAAEKGPRGLFSGSLGFFAPDGTGDWNVVIRSLLFDAATGGASIHTGSAITAMCDPEMEWEECQLKARSVIDAIGHA